MRKLLLVGLLLLVLFELANVWFIMPLTYSQRMRSIDIAYALHQWRWAFRLIGWSLLLAGAGAMWRGGGGRRWIAAVALLAVGGVTFATTQVMAADRMFLQPTLLLMATPEQNSVEPERLVVGIEIGGEARAYPLQYIGYHHQVRDRVGDQEVLVTYCTVCRTGRVYSPVVEGTAERFRLVGMDHFNAMLEDATTGSWWRQANGEAVAGPRRGGVLTEIPSVQVTLAQWLATHPQSLVMQADPAFTAQYARDYAFERGTSRSALTGTDTSSWGEKSWVVGIALGGSAVAFDWNRLRRERVVNHVVGGTPIVLALAPDDASFYAYARPDSGMVFALRGDSLVAGADAWALDGSGPAGKLTPVQASQEFWHSWRTFVPGTSRW